MTVIGTQIPVLVSNPNPCVAVTPRLPPSSSPPQGTRAPSISSSWSWGRVLPHVCDESPFTLEGSGCIAPSRRFC